MRLLLTCAAILAGGIALADPPKGDDEEKVAKAKVDVKTLTAACEAYRIKYDDYPEKLEQLVKPPDGKPFLKSDKMLTDPWKQKYQYDQKGRQQNSGKPDVWTVTPGKKVLGNWSEVVRK